MFTRCLAVLFATSLLLHLTVGRAQESKRIESTADALRGLHSHDIEHFVLACGTLENLHSDSVQKLLRVVRQKEPGDEIRVRQALETLSKLGSEQAILECIKAIDSVYRARVSWGHDPILEDRPFARALADFGKPGIDTVIDYLEVGDSDKETAERLALFAYVIKAAFEPVRVKRGTAQDYVRRYRGERPSKALDTLIKYLQLDLTELSKLIK